MFWTHLINECWLHTVIMCTCFFFCGYVSPFYIVSICLCCWLVCGILYLGTMKGHVWKGREYGMRITVFLYTHDILFKRFFFSLNISMFSSILSFFFFTFKSKVQNFICVWVCDTLGVPWIILWLCCLSYVIQVTCYPFYFIFAGFVVFVYGFLWLWIFCMNLLLLIVITILTFSFLNSLVTWCVSLWNNMKMAHCFWALSGGVFMYAVVFWHWGVF